MIRNTKKVYIDSSNEVNAETLLRYGKKYLKKPIPVRAIKIEVPFRVESLEGVVYGKKNDYLVEGIRGELYICDKEIFEESYEEVKQ